MAELVAHLRRARARTSDLATPREIEALVYLCASQRPVQIAAIGRDLAYPDESMSLPTCRRRGDRILARLGSAGLLARLPDGYSLTEAGRIAAALAMTRQPGLKEAFFDD